MIGLPWLWDTVSMNLAQKNMLYSLKKFVIYHSYLPIMATCPQRPLLSVPKVATLERFDCILQLWEKGKSLIPQT